MCMVQFIGTKIFTKQHPTEFFGPAQMFFSRLFRLLCDLIVGPPKTRTLKSPKLRKMK